MPVRPETLEMDRDTDNDGVSSFSSSLTVETRLAYRVPLRDRDLDFLA